MQPTAPQQCVQPPPPPPPPGPSGSFGPVFLMDDDMTSHELTPSEEIHLVTSRYEATSLATLFQVIWLLLKHKKLPVEIANAIVTCSGLVLRREADTMERTRFNENQNMNRKHLSLELQPQLPPQLQPSAWPRSVKIQCVALIADCVSHDQGWASGDDSLDGTYQDSHTWSELELEKNQPDRHEALAKRWLVARNVRACNDFRHHRRVFTDPELLNQIQVGDTMHLYLRACYWGWRNTVRYAKLTAMFALQVDDSFDAETDPEIMQLGRRLLAELHVHAT